MPFFFKSYLVYYGYFFLSSEQNYDFDMLLRLTGDSKLASSVNVSVSGCLPYKGLVIFLWYIQPVVQLQLRSASAPCSEAKLSRKWIAG